MEVTPENTLEIRMYAPTDASGVARLILPIQQEEFGVPITLEAQSDLLDISGFYQHGCGNFWVASAGAEIVGTIAVLDIGNGQGALRKMFVKQPYRGGEHRIAHSLLSAALSWSCSHDVCRDLPWNDG